MRILMKVALTSFGGYGNDGIGVTRAMMRRGHDCFLQPVFTSPPLDMDILQLLTKGLYPPFDLMLAHLDPHTAEVSGEERAASHFTALWTMWEWSTLNNHTDVEACLDHLKGFDHVYAYDPVSMQAFGQPGVLKPDTTLAQLQGGYDPDPWPFVEREWNTGPFRFCMVGALTPRKNVFAAIECFNELMEEHGPEKFNAELHIKNSMGTLPPQLDRSSPGIRLHQVIWPTEEVRKFYSLCHCLLAPSYGEGKNMPALEFMSTGGPVIMTNIGGHQVWGDPSYSYPVGYSLRAAPWPKAGSDALEAEVDREQLKAMMWHVYSNPAEARQKGRVASQVIPSMCSWDAVVEKFFLRLKDVSEMGRRVYEASRMDAMPSRKVAVSASDAVG